jgi:hypothetical protein
MKCNTLCLASSEGRHAPPRTEQGQAKAQAEFASEANQSWPWQLRRIQQQCIRPIERHDPGVLGSEIGRVVSQLTTSFSRLLL